MDPVDIRIALALARDGRASNTQIARRLGLSEGAVRQRLKKLLQRSCLKVQTLVHADQVPDQYMAVIGLNIEGRQLERCAEQINRLPQVQRTLIVTGRYDLLVSLLLDSHYRLVDFVTHKLSRIPGIRNSETFVCLKDYEAWFPAECLPGPSQGLRKAHEHRVSPRTNPARKGRT